MEINIHVHLPPASNDYERTFENLILHLEKRIMSALTDLQTAVAAEDTEIASAITLLTGLKAALDAAGTDPVALAALSADIGKQTQALAAAVVANTPAAPAP